MPEHADGGKCGCFGCVSVEAASVGVCVVHAVAQGDSVAPATAKNSRLCMECDDRMRSDLRLVVARWDSAQEALRPAQGGGGERQGTRVEIPAPVNLDAVDAIRDAGKAVWKIAVALVDAYAEVRLPKDQSTPNVAEWLYKWQMVRVVSMVSAEQVLRAYWLAADAAEAVARVTTPDDGKVTLPLPDQCKALALSDKGDHVQCGGELVTVWEGAAKTVLCEVNPSHMIPWDSWLKSMAARKPRGARPKLRLNRI